jgi:hypothetical protein
MIDRRRSPRVVFSEPRGARVRTVYEASVERRDANHLEVTTPHAAARGECFVIQFTADSGEVTSPVAQVVSCTPIVSADRTLWRLVLSLVPAGVEPQPTS